MEFVIGHRDLGNSEALGKQRSLCFTSENWRRLKGIIKMLGVLSDSPGF